MLVADPFGGASLSFYAFYVLVAALITLGPAALLHAALTPEITWQEAHRNKVVWIVLIAVLLGTVTGIAYWTVIAPKLRRATRRLAARALEQRAHPPAGDAPH